MIRNSLRRRLSNSGKRYNTFLGNVGDLLTNETQLSEMSPNLVASDILNFEIDSNNNIRCLINKEYQLSQFFGGTPGSTSGRNKISYFIDLDGNVDRLIGFSFSGVNDENVDRFLMFPRQGLNIENNGIRTLRVNKNHFVLSRANSIGSTSGNDGVFENCFNAIVFVPVFFETNNAGAPDGDLQRSNVTPIYITDYTRPQRPTNIQATNITSTSADINVTAPSHVNDLKYLLLFKDGFFDRLVDLDIGLTDLDPDTTYTFDRVILADEFFNISPFAEGFNFTTLE